MNTCTPTIPHGFEPKDEPSKDDFSRRDAFLPSNIVMPRNTSSHPISIKTIKVENLPPGLGLETRAKPFKGGADFDFARLDALLSSEHDKPAIIESRSMNNQAIKIKLQRDKLQRALEREQQRGRLLQAKLDSAQHQVYWLRKLLQVAHNNSIIKKIVCSEHPENERTYPMGSLLGRMPYLAPAEKQDGLVGETIGNYALGPFLGKGGFGRVYSGTHINTDKEYAIKLLDKKKIIRARRFKMVEQEIAVMQKVAHPNVVCLHDIVIHPDYICLVMDLGSTDLQSWVHYWRNEYYDIDAQVCREIILGIVKPMQHLHALGIAHLDVKDENILVTKHVWVEHLRQDHIKLCDFGLSAISTSPDASFKESGICGTTGYFAPEMVQDDDYDARAADMFSVGCTLLNVIGKVPDEWDKTYRLLKSNNTEFPKQMRSLLMQMHVDDFFFEGIGLPVAQIIRSLLRFDPKERPTPAELLQNPWLAEDS